MLVSMMSAYCAGYMIIHAMAKHIRTDEGVRLAQVWYTYEGVCSEDEADVSLLSDSLKMSLYKDSKLKASYYDHLTGLPSMTYFFELAEIGKKLFWKTAESLRCFLWILTA